MASLDGNLGVAAVTSNGKRQKASERTRRYRARQKTGCVMATAAAQSRQRSAGPRLETIKESCHGQVQQPPPALQQQTLAPQTQAATTAAPPMLHMLG
jgi:hypothetical protein